MHIQQSEYTHFFLTKVHMNSLPKKRIQPHLARGKRVKTRRSAPMAIILCAFDRARAVDAPTYSVYSQTPSSRNGAEF